MQIIVSLSKSFRRREDLDEYWKKPDATIERLNADGFRIIRDVLDKHRLSNNQEYKTTSRTDIFWMIVDIDSDKYNSNGNVIGKENKVWFEDRPFPTCYRFINEKQDALTLDILNDNYEELVNEKNIQLLQKLYYEKWRQEKGAVSSSDNPIGINSLKGLKKKEIVLIVKDYGEELSQKDKDDIEQLFNKLETDGYKVGKELYSDGNDEVSSFKFEIYKFLSDKNYNRIEGLISMKNKTVSFTRSAIYSKSMKCSNANLPRIDRILNNYDKLFSKKSTSKAVLDVYSNNDKQVC